MTTGYLQHGTASGPFRTESVPVKMSDSWPNNGTWYALFESRWRKVHLQVKRAYIVHRGERITIQIEGV